MTGVLVAQKQFDEDRRLAQHVVEGLRVATHLRRPFSEQKKVSLKSILEGEREKGFIMFPPGGDIRKVLKCVSDHVPDDVQTVFVVQRTEFQREDCVVYMVTRDGYPSVGTIYRLHDRITLDADKVVALMRCDA